MIIEKGASTQSCFPVCVILFPFIPLVALVCAFSFYILVLKLLQYVVKCCPQRVKVIFIHRFTIIVLLYFSTRLHCQ